MVPVVLIPTYNEKENIRMITERILALDGKFNVIIIDDSSPDGTGRIADSLAEKSPRVRALHRPCRAGIGPAYVTGFRHALKEGFEHIIQMDADLSHDPAYLNPLVKHLHDYDCVTTSRFLGSFVDYPPSRKITSLLINRYVRIAAGMEISDPLGGFKAFRRKVLEEIGLDRIVSRGYIFQAEVMCRVIKKGFSVKEIPIDFPFRKRGRSKLSLGIISEALLRPPMFRFIIP